jgi:hypothetical protein
MTNEQGEWFTRVFVVFYVDGWDTETAIKEIEELLASLPQEIQDKYKPRVNKAATWEYN